MKWVSRNYEFILMSFWEHLVMVVVSIAIAFAVSLIVGIWAARRKRIYSAAVAVTAFLYTIPTLALFALLIPLVGLGKLPAIIGLVCFSLLILIRNVATGIHDVPAEVVDAARGMGFSGWQVLMRIELPLALPVIIAGLRIATVTVIGIATVAAYINAGGLGTLIFDGIYQNFPTKIIVGAGLSCLLAVMADVGLAQLERRLRARQTA
jgi:osmoprotectant transport system permease protein